MNLLAYKTTLWLCAIPKIKEELFANAACRSCYVLINLKLAFLFCCYLFYDNVTSTLLELRLFMLYIYTFYIDCKSY